MKKILLIAACVVLSGCAVAGAGGPAHQAKAQQATRELSGRAPQVPGTISSGSDLDFRPTQIRNQNDRIESEEARIDSDSQDYTDELPLSSPDLYHWNLERDLPIYRQDLYRWSGED
jgi:hypothetical protein